jgi:hypothetical protein
MTRRTIGDATPRNPGPGSDVLESMTTTRVPGPAAVLLLALALAACADAAGPSAPPDATPPAAAPPDDPDALVLRVAYTGGYLAVDAAVTRFPSSSVYADGRMITAGPVPAIYPGPALPNVLVTQLDDGQVQELVDQALAAGVGGTADLGSPRVADAPSTRFTLTTRDGTYVREVYALDAFPAPGGGTLPDDGLTDEQRAGREALTGLISTLWDAEQQAYAAGSRPQPYEPAALAVVARPWTDPEDGLDHPAADWPGPPLPGQPIGSLPDLSCLTVTGDQVPEVLAPAREANAATPWRTADGRLWAVQFRPLLPDESGCADLLT